MIAPPSHCALPIEPNPFGQRNPSSWALSLWGGSFHAGCADG